MSSFVGPGRGRRAGRAPAPLGGAMGHTPGVSLSFTDSIHRLLRGARTLTVAAPSKVLTAKRFPSGLLDKRTRDLVFALAKESSPGDRGRVESSLRTSKPERVAAGLLPDAVSRYNSPSRADAIRHVISCAPLRKKGKNAVIVLVDDATHALAAANAIGRALPQFDRHSKASPHRVEALIATTGGTVVFPDAWLDATVQATRDSAELVDTPPSELNPEAFAKRATEVLRAIPGVKVRQLSGKALVEAGLGGIHGVGKGASSAPRLVIATYEPEGATGPHVALVGKGVCFDTGGLHLKGRGFMEGMKSDMGGAAAVLGAFRVLASQGTPRKITLLLAMAENAIGPASYKPDDILTLHSGKTVEINNTDAEGRLLLADACSYAARELSADVIFEAATLTGAQLIATGLLHAAVVSNDGPLEQMVVDAGRRVGDLAHPLPFAPELFRREFESKVADMTNSVANRMNAQSSCAAQFVYNHIEDAPGAGRRRFCHVDLAGPAFPHHRGTGYGVALLAEAVRELSA